jgi:hypothetical protein
VSGAKRYENRLVMRFTVYERLPFTPANRAQLRLLAHPGAGPKDDPAADHFAVLRGDRRPGPGALRPIQHGIAVGTPKTGKTIGVPDGVRALRARESGGRSETVAVRGNVATLPFRAYAWRFVR